MAGAAEQPDIARIERRTAVFEFMDMIAEDTAAGTATDLAASTTLGEKAGDEAAPFRGEVDGLCLLWQRRRNPGSDAANRRRDALQFADCMDRHSGNQA